MRALILALLAVFCFASVQVAPTEASAQPSRWERHHRWDRGHHRGWDRRDHRRWDRRHRQMWRRTHWRGTRYRSCYYSRRVHARVCSWRWR